MTFCSLPLELRNTIYAGVVVSEHPIRIVHSLSCYLDQHFFCICPVSNRFARNLCRCGSAAGESNLTYLDISLLAASVSVRTDVLAVILSSNTFRFDDETTTRCFARSVSKLAGLVRKLELFTTAHKDAIPTFMKVWMDESWEHFEAYVIFRLMSCLT